MTTPMRTLTLVYYADDEGREGQGMFDEQGVLLGAWAMNDANWRHHYFNPLMAQIGFTVVTVDEPSEEIEATLRRALGIFD